MASRLLELAKQCLSIVDSSALKDKEINMLIESGKSDLRRVGVDVDNNLEDNFLVNTLMIYVKAHFGDSDMDKRKEYLKRYKMNLRELQFSDKYRYKEESDA